LQIEPIFRNQEDRQVYYVQISSHARVNSLELSHGDAMEIVNEKVLQVMALEDTHFLFIEMAKS